MTVMFLFVNNLRFEKALQSKILNITILRKATHLNEFEVDYTKLTQNQMKAIRCVNVSFFYEARNAN